MNGEKLLWAYVFLSTCWTLLSGMYDGEALHSCITMSTSDDPVSYTICITVTRFECEFMRSHVLSTTELALVGP